MQISSQILQKKRATGTTTSTVILVEYKFRASSIRMERMAVEMELNLGDKIDLLDENDVRR
jgi:predicted nucleotidyltransferase